MGGSGGGGFFSGSTKPADLRRLVRESEDGVRDENFEAQVADLINARLTEFNERRTDVVGRHLEEIVKALGKEIQGTVSLLFGGSVAKRTYVDGLSDVDALVILNRSELKDVNPSAVREYFAVRLQERFPSTPVSVGDLAVSISFDDGEIQLLPALRDRSGIRIPIPRSPTWSPTIRPDRFARKLTGLNQALGGKLVPTIKLAKWVLSKLPENRQLTGYHVESLAIKIFDGYSGVQTTKAMLRHFFAEARQYLIRPIADSTGQSFHVDDYLGRSESLERRLAADSVGRIGRSIQNADGAKSLEQWTEILE